MKKFIQLIVLTVLTGLLGACGGSPKEPALSIKSMGDLKSRGKAIVVISSEHTTKATYGLLLEDGLSTSWAPNKDSAFDFNKLLMTSQSNPKAAPRIKALPPGTYKLMEFHYSIGRAAGKVSNSAGMKGLPLASFTIKAGEVLYLGNFRVHMVAKVFGTVKDFELFVDNDAKTARAHLAKQAPDLAAKMKTRLIKISPLFNALKKVAKAKK